MTEVPRASKNEEVIKQVLETVQKDPLYQQLDCDSQKSVEQAIEGKLTRLMDPRNALTEWEREDEIEWYSAKGARNLVKATWEGREAVKSFLDKRKAERQANGNGNGHSV